MKLKTVAGATDVPILFLRYVAALLVAALLIVPQSASSAAIKDDLIAAIEPVQERYHFMHYYWFDNNTLALTVNRAGTSLDIESFEILLLDIRTKILKTFMRGAQVTCSKPNESIVGLLTPISRIAGEAYRPMLYRWDTRSGRLSPISVPPGENWNAWLCQRTDSATANSELPNIFNYPTKFLEENHGRIRVTAGKATLNKNDKSVVSLNIDGREANGIGVTPSFLPYRNAYILGFGRANLDDSEWTEPGGRSVQEYPQLLMTPDGKIHREIFRERLRNAGLKSGSANFLPYARGTLFSNPMRPHEGGGIYLVDEKSIKRIWCTNKGNAFDRNCLTTVSLTKDVSPDGCHLAFTSESSDDPKQPYRRTLKILPLCM